MGAAGQGTTGPVFVDESGRRRRLVVRVGIAIVVAALLYALTMIVLAFLGVRVDAPGFPALEKVPHLIGRSAPGDSDHSPAPTSPSPTASAPAATRPVTTTTSVAPAPQASASAHPHAAAPTGRPGATVPGVVAVPTPAAAPTPAAVPTHGSRPTAAPSLPATSHKSTAPGATQRATPAPGVRSTAAPGQAQRTALP